MTKKRICAIIFALWKIVIKFSEFRQAQLHRKFGVPTDKKQKNFIQIRLARKKLLKNFACS